MPTLAGSQNTTISGGHFTDQSAGIINNVNISLPSGQLTEIGIGILLKASNRDAAHDSSARDYSPRCYPGTREQYIEDFVHWAIPSANVNEPLPIHWMKGLAGVGKSALAQTCAERLKKLRKLGASFFFSINERDDVAQLIPTIVYQLSTQFPDYRILVDQRIRHDETIFDKTMATQFEALIVEPLQELKKMGKSIGQRIAIIIDGLDECEKPDDQCRIIDIIAAAARDGSTPFCWAFFGRPEAHLEATFALTDTARVTSTTLLPISGDTNLDIEFYLRSGFENILRRRNIPVEPQWPSDEDIQSLVKVSNGLFIYAATALRIVAQAGSPEKALRTVCATTSNRTNDSPFAELDAIYMRVMQRIPSDTLPAVLLLCRLLCNYGSYAGGNSWGGVILRSNLLELSKVELWAAFNQLSAVLHFQDHSNSFDLTRFGNTDRPFQHATPDIIERLRKIIYGERGGSIYFYHKSFHDFLRDPMRSGTFCITSSSTRNAYYKHFLELMLKYEESYTFRGSELALAPGLPDSASSLSWPHTSELVNSVIKAQAYSWAFRSCFSAGTGLEIESQLLQRFGGVDFSKAQQNEAMLYAGYSGFLTFWRWGCRGYAKVIRATHLFRIPQYEFQTRFDVIKFEAVVKQWKECGIIKPYYPNLTSRLKSFIAKEPQDKRMSGLYHLGHGPKSVFWYWEINLEEGHYQEFQAVNLADGERVHREEQLHLWPRKVQRWWKSDQA